MSLLTLKHSGYDDALYIEPIEQNGTQSGWRLVVAIADPTAYIALDSQIEKDAKQRCFTNYLPGLTSQCCRVNYLMNYVH